MASPRSCSPRQMLPPPTTMPIRTPESQASLISEPIDDSASGLMPWELSPQSASSESLRRTRLYFLAEGIPEGLRAQLVAHEADDLDLAAELRARRLDEAGHRLLVVAQQNLVEEDPLLVEKLVDLALDDLLDL